MKKALLVVMSGLLVSILSFATPAAADDDDDDDDLKPGGRGTVTAYEGDGKTVAKVERCTSRSRRVYNCFDAGKRIDKWMRDDYCQARKGKVWYWQVGNRSKLRMTCRSAARTR